MISRYAASLMILASVSAHSSVVLYGISDHDTCVIKNDEVVKTVSIYKGSMTLTTTKKIASTGLEAQAKRALSLAREEQPTTLGFKDIVEVDGVKATLQFDDSSEARVLIQFLREACKSL